MMIMRAHALNAAFLLKNIKHFGKKNLKFSNCFFQRTRVATAVFAAVCGSFVLSEPVPAADDFTADQLEVLGNALTTTNLEGPFRFEYVTDAPKRVGYYYAPETPPFNKKHSILIKESINENLFQQEGGGSQYLCLIGAYSIDAIAKWNFEDVLEAFKGNEFNVTVNKGVTFWSNDIYAANQDKINARDYQSLIDDINFTIPMTAERMEEWQSEFSSVQNNKLTIYLDDESTLNFQRIVGGKTLTWRELSKNSDTKPWTYAFNNSVVIDGGKLIGKSTYNLDSPGKPPEGISKNDFEFYFRSSIIGGSAFIANNNTVTIRNATIDRISKKYGIVGGRAYDGTNVIKNTLYGCSADGNVIYISNSEIGTDKALSESGINIYAALSYGAATNNFAILENSTFNGNVYGSAAALGSVLDKYENGPKGDGKDLNQPKSDYYTHNSKGSSVVIAGTLTNEQILYLFNKAENQYSEVGHTTQNKYINEQQNNSAFSNKWVGLSDDNAISLNNVRLTPGSSVYASAGIFIPTTNNNAPFENAKVVNLRRGTAYLGGKNEVSSIYAKNIVFGRYYTQDQSGQKLFKDDKALRLGENISSSYAINTSGFHSSLSQRSEVQSNITNGMHNFWSGVTAVLGNTMNGNGRELAVNNNVYENSQIKERNFSLLALDNNDATEDHYFANSAKLYLAVSQGGDTTAPIAINWSKIAEYRLSFASGGQFSPDGKLSINGDNLPTFSESYSPFPTVTVLIGGKENTGSQDIISSVEDITKDFINGIRNSSFDAQITVKQSDSNAPDGARTAANAKFAIGQYLDFGNITLVEQDVPIKTPTGSVTEEDFAKKGDWVSYIEQNDSNWEGGIGIRYKLKELELADSDFQLILYGLDLKDTAKAPASADGYTLDAKLTQAAGVDGGIIVYENQKVVIRTEYAQETSDLYQDLKKEDINHENSYSGVTTVQQGSILEVIGNNALGTEDVHTNALFLHDNSQFNLGGYCQTVGSLNQFNAALNLNDLQTNKPGLLNIKQTPDRGSYIRGTVSGEAGSVLSVTNGTTTITSPNGTGYIGQFNVISGITNASSQPISGGTPILYTTVYLASPRALDKATINAQDGSSLVFDNGSTDNNYVSVNPDSNGIRHYFAGDVTAGSGYIFVSNPNIQVQNTGIVPHHLHVNTLRLNNANLVFSTLFEKDGNGFVDNSKTDRIYVENAASGTGNVLINALPGSELGYTQEGKGILLVSAPNADQTFKLTKGQVYIVQKNKLSRAEENDSDIKYELKSKNDENGNFEDDAYKYWYLVSSVNGNSPDDKDNPTPSDPNDPVKEPTQPGDTTPSEDPNGSFTPGGVRPGHSSSQIRPQLAAFATNVLAWDKLNMRLHDRVGEAYFLDPETHEVKKASGWVRFHATHAHAKVDSSARTTGNFMTTQVGTDLLRTDLNEDWRLVGGLFFGNVYGKAHTTSLLKARSKVVGYGGGAYLTLFSGNNPDEGFYTDLWVSYNHFKNEVSGDEPSVKYHSKGMNYSGEIGYTIHAATTGSTSSNNKVQWYIQPQFQATIQGIKADSFTDWTGNRVKQDGKYNVQLRTGVRVYGRQSAQGNVFVEANWIHNTKKLGITSGAESYYVDGTRNSGEGRIGWEGNITKNLLGSVTGSVKAGNKGYNEVSGNISIKYMF